jgi:predicted N-acetyltransferase YhbS
MQTATIVQRDAGLAPALTGATERWTADPAVLRPVGPDDTVAVSVLQSTVFDGPAEARMTIALRRRGALVGEMLLWQDGRPVAHTALAAMRSPSGWALLLPTAVLPEVDTGDVAAGLVAASLQQAARAGTEMAVTTGDPAFGRRMGFCYEALPSCLGAPFAGRFTGLRQLQPEARMPRAAVALLYPPEVLRV